MPAGVARYRIDVRLLLEPDLARRAAATATDAMLDEVEGALIAAERGAASAGWSALDGASHRTLYACAGRERQLGMVMALRGLMRRTGANEALPDRTGDWLEDHRLLLAACRARDGDEAARRVTVHLERAREVVRERLAAAASRSGTGVPYPEFPITTK